MKSTEIFNLKGSTSLTNNAIFRNYFNLKKTILIFILNLGVLSVIAQSGFKIEGSLQSKNNGETVPFATVALHQSSDSALVSGTITNADGIFRLSTTKPDNCFLEISHLGFEPKNVEISFNENQEINIGIILLNENIVE